MNIAVINIFEHVSCYTYIGVSRICVLIDRVQNTLLQNMVSWQIKYFKLKESEKWHVQEGTSPETHVRCFPYAQRKVHPYLQDEGNGTPLQYSCLENPMDGGAC